ncbi:hypothetical protein BH23PAT2_BH23PAT2_06060 [soil metagenome]
MGSKIRFGEESYLLATEARRKVLVLFLLGYIICGSKGIGCYCMYEVKA